MATLIIVLLFGALAFAVGVHVWFDLKYRPDVGRLRLKEVMRRRGAFLPHPMTALAIADAALAARRCLACGNKALCDELLDAGRTDGYGAFCPNGHYIERLRQGSLSFR